MVLGLEVANTVLTALSLIAIVALVYQLALIRSRIQKAKTNEAVGKWSKVVRSGDLSTLRGSGVVPFLSLRELVEHGASYKLKPTRLRSGPDAPKRSRMESILDILKPSRPRSGPDTVVLSGWANFLNSIGFEPEDLSKSPAFTKERISQLIEKRLPMRWTGSEFVCMCALLGFQQAASRGGYSFRMDVLPLPALWFSPLGYITLVDSPQPGIVASFRPRAYEHAALSKSRLDKFDPDGLCPPKFSIKRRSYYTVHSLWVPNRDEHEALFFGGFYSPNPIDSYIDEDTDKKDVTGKDTKGEGAKSKDTSKEDQDREDIDKKGKGKDTDKKDADEDNAQKACAKTSGCAELIQLSLENDEIYSTVEADLIQAWGLDHSKFRLLRFNKPERQMD
jgi:hypothetical protein